MTWSVLFVSYNAIIKLRYNDAPRTFTDCAVGSTKNIVCCGDPCPPCFCDCSNDARERSLRWFRHFVVLETAGWTELTDLNHPPKYFCIKYCKVKDPKEFSRLSTIFLQTCLERVGRYYWILMDEYSNVTIRYSSIQSYIPLLSFLAARLIDLVVVTMLVGHELLP